MSEDKVMNRWLVVIGALVIQLCLGAIYAWSVFTPSLRAPVAEGGFGFTAAQTQWVFSVGLATFAVVMVLAGRWQAKSGPRIVALSGGILLGLGYILAKFFGTSFLGQIICIGLIGGAGIGLAYVCPIAVGMKWFPDKKGLITGLAVAGFGFGALIWIKLAGAWGHLIETMGILNVWGLYGIIFGVAVALGSIVMINPPAGWKPAGWEPPAAERTAGGGGMLPGQMLRTPQFYMLWITFIFSAMAGLMTIGIIKLFGIDALQAGGYSAVEASAIAGTAMAVFYSLANGIGRIVWGTISDWIGRKTAIALMTAIQGVMMLIFFRMGGTPALLYLGAAIVGFNFGGNFALFPTATADFFGTSHVGQNYGWMFTAYGVGGIVGPVMAGMFRDSGSWVPAFVISGILCLVATVITLALRRPRALQGV
ncbi:MAG: OFA family MFS transporter [Candidatus Krumholzibacteriota bacterium]|nr:OFA family MFS transporter [Candidatus Krumholzibacteriota bacterium]